jgi:hypothetical protein
VLERGVRRRGLAHVGGGAERGERTPTDPDTDALYRDQARETDKKKREVMLHQIQRLMHERVRYGLIFDYIWPSAIGPRVAEPALLMINPYPWSAPLEEVRLKRQ